MLPPITAVAVIAVSLTICSSFLPVTVKPKYSVWHLGILRNEKFLFHNTLITKNNLLWRLSQKCTVARRDEMRRNSKSSRRPTTVPIARLWAINAGANHF
jgi:hypothetical protein